MTGKPKGSPFIRMLLLTGIMLLSIPSIAQTYYRVYKTSTPQTVGGVTVSVTSTNGDSVDICAVASPYLLGNGTTGDYTYTFSGPVTAIRLHIDALTGGEALGFLINGVSYPLTSANVSALSSPCNYSTVAAVSGGDLVDAGGGSSATVDINPGFEINSFTVLTDGTDDGVIFDFNFAAAPYFTGGAMQNFPVCQNGGATPFNALLEVKDASNTDVLTWTVLMPPVNGTLGNLGYTTGSTGGAQSPSLQEYTPILNYSGPDSFSFTIDDGNGGRDTTMIYVSVNPVPDVTITPTSQTLCTGAMTDTAFFTGTVPGTSFAWMNDNVSIGLASNGAGDFIESFTAMNTTSDPSIANIMVMPVANGCNGPAQNFTITVKPTPDVTVPGSTALCNGDMTSLMSFTGNVIATSFDWTNDNTTIGLAATGNGDINPFTVTNSTVDPVISTITVTPSADGCTGIPQTFTITVNPTPVHSGAMAYEVCNNTTFTYVPASATAGITNSWTRDVVTGISNPAMTGTGTITETLDNTTNDQVTVTYMDTLMANGCWSVEPIMVTVNPTPMLSSTLTPTAQCSGLFTYTPTSNTLGGSINYLWSRAAVAGIAEAATTNSGGVSEPLTNTTPNVVPVNYDYTVVYTSMSNSVTCSYTQTVTVSVKPTPVLSGIPPASSICDSTLFSDTLTSATAGTVFSWTRAAISGIGNSAASGVDTVREWLDNTTVSPIVVTYVANLQADGCTNTQNIAVSVNPTPTLLGSLTAGICDSALFLDTLTSATPGTIFSWSRAAVTGISNGAATGMDTVREWLNSTATGVVTVLYVDTLKINGCINTQTVTVTVNPRPVLSSPTSQTLCDRATFNYSPTSGTTGTTFSWMRPFVVGIGLTPGSGTGNPNEQMINNTNTSLNVIYVYTLTANGCPNTQNVVVTVRPTPWLSSDTTFTICSGTPFNYTPASFVSGATFAWKRAAVAGIIPGVSSSTVTGTGIINETLTDTFATPVTAVYVYTLTIGSCAHSQNVKLTLNPSPVIPVIAIAPGHTLCSNTMYQNFGAATPPPTGTTYTWTATNAFVPAVGESRQNSLVNFSTPGSAQVMLTATKAMAPTTCISRATYDVTVLSSVSDAPRVIYYNGQFICLQNGMDSYQWGYDDAVTLDSTAIAGENDQTYFHSRDEVAYKNYWVMTVHNGCMQKSYYNVPLGVTDINTARVSEINLFPNPASSYINVEVNTEAGGTIQLEVLNMVGQKLNIVPAVDHKAKIDISSFPAGFYMVDCYRDGVKIAAAKFIKN